MNIATAPVVQAFVPVTDALQAVAGAASINYVSNAGSQYAVPAVVIDYDTAWPAMFERVAAAVTEALTGIDHSVEHIGSTAVPGRRAKPIIDVFAVLRLDVDVAEAIKALDRHRWHHEGDGGRPGRESFTVRRDLPYQHLYVVVHGSEQHMLPTRFRDILRADGRAREQYAELKERLAPMLTADRVTYTESKTELIKAILRSHEDDAR